MLVLNGTTNGDFEWNATWRNTPVALVATDVIVLQVAATPPVVSAAATIHVIAQQTYIRIPAQVMGQLGAGVHTVTLLRNGTVVEMGRLVIRAGVTHG